MLVETTKRLDSPPGMQVGICSTYARACGLATFAADLEAALLVAPGIGAVRMIVMTDAPDSAISDRHQGQSVTTVRPKALPDIRRREKLRAHSNFPDGRGDQPKFGPEIAATIRVEEPATYEAAARAANELCDAVIVQHEFGIYGGPDGEDVLKFMGALKVPVLLTLHTVLPAFTSHQANVLRAACSLADIVTVFTPTALKLLEEQRIVSAPKVRIVPHGAPAELFERDRDTARKVLGLADEFVMSTFGLVSPGKGLELAIDAFAQVVKQIPAAKFIIAGRTHPGVVRRDGESYRASLRRLVELHGIADNVRMIDEFLPIDGIADLLAASDLFVTPYINPDQIVSGALTFALASGVPVVSTPYRYAIDQLSGGAGTIVHDRSASDVADAIMTFALSPEARLRARQHAQAIGSTMQWSSVGALMATLVSECVDVPESRGVLAALPLRRGDQRGPSILPFQRVRPHSWRPARNSRPIETEREPVRPLAHLRRLVDDTGIVQHAVGSVPLRSSGYCVDDVSRLVPIALAHRNDDGWDAIAAQSLAFLLDAFDPDPEVGGGALRNFMSYDRRWLDEPHFGDHVGRAAMAFGAAALCPTYAEPATRALRRISLAVPANSSIHMHTYLLLALTSAPSSIDPDSLRIPVAHLCHALRQNATKSWHWFEPMVRYDAAALPLALLRAGSMLGEARVLDSGFQSLAWLNSHIDRGDHYRFPGHLGWRPGSSIDLSGDEQPLEIRSFVEANAAAYELTGDGMFRARALDAFAWFSGRNRLAAQMVDTYGGCRDGLGTTSPNENRGAESTLSYVSSYLAVRSLVADAARTSLCDTGLAPRLLASARVMDMNSQSSPCLTER